jgi:hypothetical protein
VGSRGVLELQYFGIDMILVLLSCELKIREQVIIFSDSSLARPYEIKQCLNHLGFATYVEDFKGQKSITV